MIKTIRKILSDIKNMLNGTYDPDREFYETLEKESDNYNNSCYKEVIK